MKYWKRLLSMTLAAALLLAQPGGMVLAGAANLPKTVSSGMIARATALDSFVLESGAASIITGIQ